MCRPGGLQIFYQCSQVQIYNQTTQYLQICAWNWEFTNSVVNTAFQVLDFGARTFSLIIEINFPIFQSHNKLTIPFKIECMYAYLLFVGIFGDILCVHSTLIDMIQLTQSCHFILNQCSFCNRALLTFCE